MRQIYNKGHRLKTVSDFKAYNRICTFNLRGQFFTKKNELFNIFSRELLVTRQRQTHFSGFFSLRRPR
jgi:hypothetical protein